MRILVFAGSTRADSLNKKLARVAARAARDAGAEVTEIDLRDFPMPLYDADLEKAQGPSEHARRFKALLSAHEGWLVASPEYNGGPTGVLKNAIDWASRPEPGEKRLAAFQGKVVGLLAASPGGLGGARGLAILRLILSVLGVLVVPEQVTLPRADGAFGPDGELLDPNQAASVERVAAAVTRLIR
jgi:chromate reductase